jgi:hypothetical protein
VDCPKKLQKAQKAKMIFGKRVHGVFSIRQVKVFKAVEARKSSLLYAFASFVPLLFNCVFWVYAELTTEFLFAPEEVPI